MKNEDIQKRDSSFSENDMKKIKEAVFSAVTKRLSNYFNDKKMISMFDEVKNISDDVEKILLNKRSFVDEANAQIRKELEEEDKKRNFISLSKENGKRVKSSKK